MTSIRHSDPAELARRRERVANELRLIDAEIERRAEKAPRRPVSPSSAWIAGFRDYDPCRAHQDNPDWIAGRAERDRLAALGAVIADLC